MKLKLEVSSLSGDKEVERAFRSFQRLAPAIKILSLDKLSLLGAPIHDNLISNAIKDKLSKFEIMRERLSSLSSHHALFLLKNAISIPRLNYLLRCTPCWKEMCTLQHLDDSLKAALEEIINCSLSSSAWSQATLPICMG